MGHFGLTLEKEGSKSGMVATPRGEPSALGGKGVSPPRPALWGGGGAPRPAPLRKSYQNRREVVGRTKSPILKREGTNDGTILQHHVLNIILGNVNDDGDYDGDVGDDNYDGDVNYDYYQDYEC